MSNFTTSDLFSMSEKTRTGVFQKGRNLLYSMEQSSVKNVTAASGVFIAPVYPAGNLVSAAHPEWAHDVNWGSNP